MARDGAAMARAGDVRLLFVVGVARGGVLWLGMVLLWLMVVQASVVLVVMVREVNLTCVCGILIFMLSFEVNIYIYIYIYLPMSLEDKKGIKSTGPTHIDKHFTVELP